MEDKYEIKKFYVLRGSYAIKILNNGVEIRDVADLLGHKNIETTENFYISSTEDSRKYATEIFDNISKSKTINKIIEYKIDFWFYLDSLTIKI